MKSKKFTMGLLIFYLIVLTWIIIFKLQFSFENLPHIRNINLIPFGESVIINGKMDFGEIIQNALVFIPFGVLMHVLWEEKPLIKQMAPVVAVSILLMTTVDMITGIRSGSINWQKKLPGKSRRIFLLSALRHFCMM